MMRRGGEGIMRESNYDRMRDQMEREFLKYDQERMIAPVFRF